MSVNILNNCENVENIKTTKKLPTSISFHQLTVKVPKSQFSAVTCSGNKKIILNSISGIFTPGTLNGLLGPSGAGKTTLLNALSGSNLNFTGSLQYGNFSSDTQKLPVSYYIRQHTHDCIVPELTVGQLLRYSYCFKNDVTGVGGSKNRLKEHIEKTMFALSLPEELLTRQLKKCSGGEQKRVAIAQELMSLTHPTFLFLDEPTTGLDSVSAFEVMSSLKGLIKEGSSQMTIIASIHAPNDETLQLFDQLYVLAKGGVSVYEGSPENMRKTLEKVTNVKVPSDQPPTEVLLKMACSGLSDENVSKLAMSHRNEYLESDKMKKTFNQKKIFSQHLKGRKTFRFSNLSVHLARQLRITFLAQLPYLLFSPLFLAFFYSVLCTIFSLKMTTANACYPLEGSPESATSVTAFTSGTCPDSESRLKNEGLFKENAHYLSYVVIVVSFISMLGGTVMYSKTLKIFASEHQNRWYSLGVFALSSSLASLLEIILTSLFVASFSYLISGQQNADTAAGLPFNWTRLALYVFFVGFVAVYAQSVGHLLGAIFADWPMIGMISCELVATTASLFNGLFVKLDRMGSQMMVNLEEVFGLAGLSRGIIYAIFGYQRCNFDREYSWILVEYNVKEERLTEYVWQALGNVMLVKAVTLVILWFRYTYAQRKKNAKDEKNQLFFDNSVDLEEVNHHQKNLIVEIKIKNNGNPQFNENLKNEQKYMSCSKEKILLAWHNLSLFQSSSLLFDRSSQQNLNNSTSNQKPILRHLDGAIRFNSLTALMGTSGAGKTSLLRVLNGQCKTRLSPEVDFYLSTLTFIKTCFISQEVSGHLLRGLTAFQMLRYASMLRNTASTEIARTKSDTKMQPEVQTKFNHDSIASRWLSELGLKDAASTRVEALSGGEAKRLAVAIELTSATMPNLLCIDEPTSGLDSNSAETVVKTLKRLTEVHPLLTILTSIHQPTAEVLALYDFLYVLARGGVCIYAGHPDGIQATLDAVEVEIAEFPDTTSSPFPIENLMKQSCLGAETPTNRALASLTRQKFDSNALRVEIVEQTALVPDGVPTNRARFRATSVLTLAARYLAYVRGHLWKEWLFFAACSTIFATSLRFLYSPTIATYSGCLNLEDDLSACALKTPDKLKEEFGLKDNVVYGYFFITFYQMLIILGSSRGFLAEFRIFENEHRNNVYSAGAWYLVMSIAEIIPLIPGILVFVTIINIYEPVVEYVMYPHIVLLMVLGMLAMTAAGHIISLVGKGNLLVQTVLIIGLFLFSLLIGNFIIPVAEMHYFWQWAANFSVARYLLEALMLLQYAYGRCPEKQIQSVLYSMSLDGERGEGVYVYSLFMLLFNAFLFRMVALWLLVRQANPIQNRKRRIERLAAYRRQSKMIF